MTQNEKDYLKIAGALVVTVATACLFISCLANLFSGMVGSAIKDFLWCFAILVVWGFVDEVML